MSGAIPDNSSRRLSIATWSNRTRRLLAGSAATPMASGSRPPRYARAVGRVISLVTFAHSLARQRRQISAARCAKVRGWLAGARRGKNNNSQISRQGKTHSPAGLGRRTNRDRTPVGGSSAVAVLFSARHVRAAGASCCEAWRATGCERIRPSVSRQGHRLRLIDRAGDTPAAPTFRRSCNPIDHAQGGDLRGARIPQTEPWSHRSYHLHTHLYRAHARVAQSW